MPTRVLYPPDATTRTTGSTYIPSRPGDFLAPAEVVESPETGLRYRVERLLGQGGFGQVYLAHAARPIGGRPRGGLHQGQRQHRRLAARGVLRPAARRPSARDPGLRPLSAVPPDGHAGALLYALALEYAPHGDLERVPRSARERLVPETAVRREIAGILQVLGKLHRGQLLHRDLTPLNVFVCDGRRLKLGDFGIVQQQSDRRGITARTMNALTAPSDILAGEAPKWQARDDVYQVGQLLAMLVQGRRAGPGADRRRARAALQRSPQGDRLPLHRRAAEALRERRRADRRRCARRRRRSTSRRAAQPEGRAPRVHRHPHRRAASDAARAATRAGAIVHGGPSAQTTVVVRGRPNAQQAAGRDAGIKLMEIKRLREKGHRITLLSEKQFWKLAGGVPIPKPGRRRN